MNLRSWELESSEALRHNPEAVGKNPLFWSRWVKLYSSGNLCCMSGELKLTVVADGGKGFATAKLGRQIGTEGSFNSN